MLLFAMQVFITVAVCIALFNMMRANHYLKHMPSHAPPARWPVFCSFCREDQERENR